MFSLMFALLGGLISLVYSLFWIFMLVDCAMHEPSEGSTKLVWILIILFGLGVGPLIYFLVRRPERIASFGR
ncbi:MAG: PLDc N-terminal domain-containing protein [Planctomycetaceae bacterium]